MGKYHKDKSYCAFPHCKTKRTEKYLFSSPDNVKLREQWLKAMNCERRFSPNTRFSVCEDHFDLPNDLQNYSRFLHGRKIFTQHKLKDDAVPSKSVKSEEILNSTDSREMISHDEIMFIDVGTLQNNEISENTETSEITTSDKGVQCNLVPETRNQVAQCYFAPIKPKIRSKAVQTSDKFFTKNTVRKKDVALSPIIFEDSQNVKTEKKPFASSDFFKY